MCVCVCACVCVCVCVCVCDRTIFTQFSHKSHNFYVVLGLGWGLGQVSRSLGSHMYLGTWTSLPSPISGSKPLSPNWHVSLAGEQFSAIDRITSQIFISRRIKKDCAYLMAWNLAALYNYKQWTRLKAMGQTRISCFGCSPVDSTCFFSLVF